MTGKIQMIPLYKINKILHAIKNEKQPKVDIDTIKTDVELKSEKSAVTSKKEAIAKRKP
jgi:hypothetical protein